MSEGIYAFLLRLYPSRFRKAYGEEALQLFRDRSRDERGLLSRLRLWCDLLGDLVLSLPIAYRSDSTPVVASQGEHFWDGTPSFRSLEAGTVSPSTLFYGGIVSLVIYACILTLVGHGEDFLHAVASESQRTPRSFDTVPKRIPDIDLSYSPTTPVSGSVVHLTAKVFALGGETPTGTVRFFDGVTVLLEGELDNGSISVKGRLPMNAKHLLRATYLGDGKYSSASSVQPKE